MNSTLQAKGPAHGRDPLTSPSPATLSLDPQPALTLARPNDQWKLQQRALISFCKRVNDHPTLSVVLRDAVALVSESLHIEHGGVIQFIGDQYHATLIGRDGDGLPFETAQHSGSLDERESIFAYALTAGSFLTSDNLAEETRFHDKYLVGRNIVSALVVPLVWQNKPWGAIAVFSSTPRVFSYDDVTFAETVAGFLNSSIARVLAEEKLFASETAKAEIRGELDRLRTLTNQTSATLGQIASQFDKPIIPEEAAIFRPISSTPPGPEQRQIIRRTYRVRQWIAIADERRLPEAKDFVQVDFYDLSAIGCSFYYKGAPKFETIVVALGQSPSLIYFYAKLIRVMPLADSLDKTSQLVGCEFTSRLHLPPNYLSS